MYHLVQPETIPVWVEAGGATAEQVDEEALAELEPALEALTLVVLTLVLDW